MNSETRLVNWPMISIDDDESAFGGFHLLNCPLEFVFPSDFCSL